MTETRKTEQRYITSDPVKMLNMYLAKSVYKTWNEDFIDEDTNEKLRSKGMSFFFTWYIDRPRHSCANPFQYGS